MSENKDNDITVCDNFENKSNNNPHFLNFLDIKKIKFINADFSLEKSYLKLDNYYDDFYLLASQIGVNNTLENPEKVIKINTSIILNTLNWLSINKVNNFLFTSTSECYNGTIDRFNYKVPTSEDVPLTITDISHPRYTYSVTKMLGESAFLNYSTVYGFNCKIIRYNNIFGPNMGFGHVIPHLVERFFRKEDPFIIYGGNQTRSFCYIEDGALGTIKAMGSDCKREIFHIGSDIEITIEELVKETGKILNFNGKYIDDIEYPGSVSRRCPNIEKARKILKFEPKVDWKDGLRKTVLWYHDYFKQNPKKKYFKKPQELIIPKR